MIDMQLKTSDLLSLSQQLIPKRLALAFGIASGDEQLDEAQPGFAREGSALKAKRQFEAAAETASKRHKPADGAADGQEAVPAAKAGCLPTCSQQTTSAQQPAVSQPSPSANIQQVTHSKQQQDVVAMAQAAASMQAAALAQQAAASMQTTSAMAHAQAAAAAAASMQTTSGVSGGYPPHAAAATSGRHAVLGGHYHGYPAAVGHAYHYGHPMVSYMQATPQAMAAMSNMSGSIGCAPMSMYGAPLDHQMMQRQDDEEDTQGTRAVKRPRLVWTSELHKIFEAAVQKLGVDKAVPKTIMQMMKVDGLTRENVASHLQKYRLSIKKTTDTDGKQTSAANTSAEGTGEASASEKGGAQDGATANGTATTSTAAEGGVCEGSGGVSRGGTAGTVGDGQSSGGGCDGPETAADLDASRETSSSKDMGLQNGTAAATVEQVCGTGAGGGMAEKIVTMQQLPGDAGVAANAAVGAAAAAAAAGPRNT